MHARAVGVLFVLVALALSAAGGCLPKKPAAPDPAQMEMFVPTGMRIHPIFTQAKDWNGDGKLDGVEALIEFQDQFEDPTKAAGRVVFELFPYRPNWPDPRGRRVGEPWVSSLGTLAEQKERWNRTSRTYTFQLKYPQIDAEKTYVLTAIFEKANGGRFFDQLILGPSATESDREPKKKVESKEKPGAATSRPTSVPATQPSPAGAIQIGPGMVVPTTDPSVRSPQP